jgi:hypothetical protein
MLEQVPISCSYRKIHEPVRPRRYLGLETFSTFFYVFEISAITRDTRMRWNNGKLWKEFPDSFVKAITLSTLQRFLYADDTISLCPAAFCNLENWVHRYTMEPYVASKIFILFPNCCFRQMASKTLVTYFKNGF